MIYTKTGDKGETSLANGQRVSKADARLEAYGTADELNSWVGLLRAQMTDEKWQKKDEELSWIQNRLFNLGAALSEAPGEWLKEENVTQLEAWIDAMQAELPKQHSFVLPVGGEAVGRCHVCRTVCRRLERRMIALGAEGVALRFINRLSDYLFVLARYCGMKLGEKEEAWEK